MPGLQAPAHLVHMGLGELTNGEGADRLFLLFLKGQLMLSLLLEERPLLLRHRSLVLALQVAPSLNVMLVLAKQMVLQGPESLLLFRLALILIILRQIIRVQL